MARMKARLAALAAALGVAIALALPPRAALASTYVKFDYQDLSLAPIVFPDSSFNVTFSDYSFQYPLLPYSLPYTDSTSSSYAESGSAHSDVLLTEQEYTIDLNQFDAKLKFWVPTIQMSPSSTQTGIVFPNPYRSSSTVINGSINWPNNFYISGAAGGTGAWSFDGRFYDDNGYFYSKDDQFTVNEHDLTGEVATDYASEGASTGTIEHESFLADGLYFSTCPFSSASFDGSYYFFLGFGESSSGASNAYFEKGTRFYTYSSRYNYWCDDWDGSNPWGLDVFGWCYRISNTLYVSTSFDYNSFTIPQNSDVVGLILRRPNNYIRWSEKIVMRPPSIYMVDPIVENTIIEETEQQTDTLMDTTGSGSILNSLTDGGVQGFNQKLGFLGQIGDVANTFNSSFTSASANSVVQFPGVVVQGITLIPAQGVDIWQNGLNAFEQPVKMVFTFAFVAAWVNGMKRLLDYQILGEPYSGEVQE